MPQYDKAWEKMGQDRRLAPFPDPSDFLNGPGNKTRHETRGDVKQVIRRTTLAIHVHATRTATHLPEARGWPRPQCSHDSLCRPGQTSEHRSQCHHLLWCKVTTIQSQLHGPPQWYLTCKWMPNLSSTIVWCIQNMVYTTENMSMKLIGFSMKQVGGV